jgi:hypothetical protein
MSILFSGLVPPEDGLNVGAVTLMPWWFTWGRGDCEFRGVVCPETGSFTEFVELVGKMRLT